MPVTTANLGPPAAPPDSRAATGAEIKRYLLGHDFGQHSSEPTWFVRDNVRVVVRPGHKLSIYVFDRVTGDGWIGHLESIPLRVLAAVLEQEPRPIPTGMVLA